MIQKDIQELSETYQCIIPNKRERIWKIQMEMWIEFDRICKKHEIKYFFCWGALLGAVRHQGFIPWDDDIDVVMARKDYDSFAGIILKELKKPYYVQIPRTNGRATYLITKIINEDTTCVNISYEAKYNHQGISLDIVPLDGTSNSKTKRVIQILQHEGLGILINNYGLGWKCLNFKKKVIKAIAIVYFFITKYEDPAVKLEKIRARYGWEESNTIAEFAHGVRFPKEWFLETKELLFEGYKVPVPGKYEKVLEKLYGDYRKLPEKKNRIITDSEMAGWITEPDISYHDYLSLRYKKKKSYQKTLFDNFVNK